MSSDTNLVDVNHVLKAVVIEGCAEGLEAVVRQLEGDRPVAARRCGKREKADASADIQQDLDRYFARKC